MSFDIYGNHLRRRHCKVHPEVHEEYREKEMKPWR